MANGVIAQPSKPLKRSFDNATMAEHPEIVFEEFVGVVSTCTGLYIECVQHGSGYPSQIDKMPSAIPPEKPINIIPLVPIEPIINPNLIPIIVAPFNQTAQALLPLVKPLEVFDKHYPWSVSVYVEGKLVCIGILLNENWVITEATCLSLIKLEYDYVVVVLGAFKQFLKVKGIYEQIIRVNCIVRVGHSNAGLLYLERRAHFNRQVLPTFLPEV